VDGADVRVSERGRDTGFLKKVLACRAIKARIFLYNFYRHIALQCFVVSSIDNAHSAFTNLCLDTTMAKDLTDHGALPSHIMLGFAQEIRQRCKIHMLAARLGSIPCFSVSMPRRP